MRFVSALRADEAHELLRGAPAAAALLDEPGMQTSCAACGAAVVAWGLQLSEALDGPVTVECRQCYDARENGRGRHG